MLKIAVSRCLLGDKVRYDGTSKFSNDLEFLDQYHCQVIPFCPEVSIGMGIPRLPIQLEMVADEILARRVGDAEKDYTQLLKDYASEFVQLHPDLTAIVNKKGSPSCGFQSTRLYQDNKLINQSATGIFMKQVVQLMPNVLIIDEELLAVKEKKSEFLKALKQKAPR